MKYVVLSSICSVVLSVFIAGYGGSAYILKMYEEIVPPSAAQNLKETKNRKSPDDKVINSDNLNSL